MVKLGGIVGAVFGFLVGLLITEVIIGNPANSASGATDWQLWVDVLLAVIGALGGSWLARRFADRSAKPSY